MISLHMQAPAPAPGPSASFLDIGPAAAIPVPFSGQFSLDCGSGLIGGYSQMLTNNTDIQPLAAVRPCVPRAVDPAPIFKFSPDHESARASGGGRVYVDGARLVQDGQTYSAAHAELHCLCCYPLMIM